MSYPGITAIAQTAGATKRSCLYMTELYVITDLEGNHVMTGRAADLAASLDFNRDSLYSAVKYNHTIIGKYKARKA